MTRRLAALLLAAALGLAACVGGGLGPGRADPDPQDQTPNH